MTPTQLDPAQFDTALIKARYERIKAALGPEVTVVVATKYVPLGQMAVLADAGIDVVGENQAQSLEAKHAEYGSAFRWHFIGALQSNKVKVVNRCCELVHSLDSHSAARRLEIPAFVQVNLAGEASKGGVSPDELQPFLEYDIQGLSTMPPASEDAEGSRTYFSQLRALADSHGLGGCSMGTTQDFEVAAEEGATHVRIGSILFDSDRSGRYDPHVMALGGLWNKTLVYFGIAEEDDGVYDDEESYSAAEETLEQSYKDRPNVRRLTSRRKGPHYEDWTESDADSAPVAAAPSTGGSVRSLRSAGRAPTEAPQGRSHIEAVPNANAVRVHLVLPRSFNDAQQIADKFKQGIPVILNLQSADAELAKRLIDFTSGLTYALNGGMQRVAEKVFLLTPQNVEVSAEQRAQLLERGGFYNQA